MIRGSAYSAILHGLFLAGLFFGLPSLMLLVDEPTLEEAPRIEVATVTPEESAAIDKAAARPLPDIEAPSGGRSGLTTDAINTETPEDRRSILQSSAASSTQTNSAESKIDEKTPTPNPTPDTTPPTTAVVDRPQPDPTPPLPQPPLPVAPSEPQPQVARIEPPVVQPPPTPILSEVTPTPLPPDPARPTLPDPLPVPPTPQTA